MLEQAPHLAASPSMFRVRRVTADMIRILPALVCLVLLSPVTLAQTPELDPRLQVLKDRVSVALPKWVRDSDLAPQSVGAWDLELAGGELTRCSLFKDAMGADPDTFIKGMAMMKPGAKLVGEPHTIKTPSAIEVQLVFEVPGEGYGFVWSQVLGLRGKTACSPALFSMNTLRDKHVGLEKFTEEMQARKALLRPAFDAHLRYAFGLRTAVKDDVATVMSGPSFPVPKGWKSVAEPIAVAGWAGDDEARLELDVESTLEHSADAIILAATAKMSRVAPAPNDKHDVTFVDGKDQVRLKVIEQDRYLYLLTASAPVAADAAKRAAFNTAIAPTFAERSAAPSKPAERKPEKGEKH